MAKCIVIGGGLAGISTAVFLSKNKHNVLLLEASPKLGGRAYSFQDKITKEVIDNGQHIFVGAYKATFELLKIIGSQNLPEYQTKLRATYIDKLGKKYLLEAPHKFYPLNLLHAILNFDLISFAERVGIVKFIAKLFFLNEKKTEDKTVLEFLKGNKQSENSIKVFWELLVVSTLNTPIKEASLRIFIKVLKEIFLNGNKASTIILPKYGLSELFSIPANEYLKKNGATVSLSERVVSIETNGGKIIKIKTTKREITDFDYAFSAVPFNSLQKIFPELPFIKYANKNLATSSIITIYLWSAENILEEKFFGLIGSKIHWVYKNKNHISVVISSAEKMIELTSEEIYKICKDELKKYFPKFTGTKIQHYKVLKEKRATFKSTPESDIIRRKIKSPYKNFLLAGDWTNTQLPATIESAILSGKIIAQKVR